MFFEDYWQDTLKQNVIRVPEGCLTMNQAMELAVMFFERNECTREKRGWLSVNSSVQYVGNVVHTVAIVVPGIVLLYPVSDDETVR